MISETSFYAKVIESLFLSGLVGMDTGMRTIPILPSADLPLLTRVPGRTIKESRHQHKRQEQDKQGPSRWTCEQQDDDHDGVCVIGRHGAESSRFHHTRSCSSLSSLWRM